MALNKFQIPPQITGYSVKRKSNSNYVDLDGGFGKYRRDLISNKEVVSVQWNLDGIGYQYFQAFLRTKINDGALPFTMDMILDSSALAEYEVTFIPRSIRLGSYDYNKYMVKAQVEVTPKSVNLTSDNLLINQYGSEAKLELLPLQKGYGITFGERTVGIDYQGGAYKVGPSVGNNSVLIKLSWSLTPEEFDYFQAFYRTALSQGCDTFLQNIITGGQLVQEHTVRLVPGTVRYSLKSGLTFVVSASLEVLLPDSDSEYDDAIVMLLEEYGDAQSVADILNQLEQFANIDLPDNL